MVAPHLTLIAPAHNEEANIGPLIAEVRAALDSIGGAGLPWEFIIVDDGSTDGTRAAALAAAATDARIRCIAMQHTPPGKGNGQSAAFHAGIRAAAPGSRLIAMIDADLQNDPADIPTMLSLMQDSAPGGGADFVQGDRSRNRKDGLIKRCSSVVGRLFRRMILGDSVRDTGCSLRIMRREIAERLPLEFRGMHRFIPITARKMGYKVVEMPVNHRPRSAGTTKYGSGIGRAIPGLMDCFSVRWMNKRRRPIAFAEQHPAAAGSPGAKP